MSYRPPYCSQPTVRNCWECALTNYGRDCCNHSIAAREDGSRGGKIGGSSRSAAKIAAARANGKRGGRPKKGAR